MKAYLINLENARDRLAHSVKQLTDEGFSTIRIDAVNGKKLDINKVLYNELQYKLKHGKKTNKSEIGCYLSHIKAMKEFLNTKDSHALIVEDDIDLLKNIDKIIKQALKYQHYWDILRLSGLHRGAPIHCIPMLDNRFLSINFTRLMGAGAYVINRKAATAYVKKLLPMSIPFDHAYDREWLFGLKAMSINPPIVLQDNLPFESQIKAVKNSKYPSYLRYWTVFPFRLYTELSRVIFRFLQLLQFKMSN